MTAMRRMMMMTCFPSEQSVTDCSRIHRWTQRSFGELGLQRQVIQEERSGGTFYPSYISFPSYLLDEDHCGVCVQLKTRQGCEYLMQYDKESIISDWLKVIQDTIGQLVPDGAHRPVILRSLVPRSGSLFQSELAYSEVCFQDQEHLSDSEDDGSSDKEDKDRRSICESLNFNYLQHLCRLGLMKVWSIKSSGKEHRMALSGNMLPAGVSDVFSKWPTEWWNKFINKNVLLAGIAQWLS